MPKLYEYMGIVIRIYSADHEPVHVHAEYNDNIVKVSFFIRDGAIYRTTYTNDVGKFPPSKMKDLKELISLYKEDIIEAWYKHFVWRTKIECKKITKRI